MRPLSIHTCLWWERLYFIVQRVHVHRPVCQFNLLILPVPVQERTSVNKDSSTQQKNTSLGPQIETPPCCFLSYWCMPYVAAALQVGFTFNSSKLIMGLKSKYRFLWQRQLTTCQNAANRKWRTSFDIIYESKMITPVSASSNAHHLLSVSKDKIIVVITMKHMAQERGEVTNREIFPSMSSSAFLPSLSWMHSYTCIYQQIFQLYGLYQVRIPVETNYRWQKKGLRNEWV